MQRSAIRPSLFERSDYLFGQRCILLGTPATQQLLPVKTLITEDPGVLVCGWNERRTSDSVRIFCQKADCKERKDWSQR